MKAVLIVGPGSVGQSLGYWFSRSGFAVTFLVRKHHPESSAQEFSTRELVARPLRSSPTFSSYRAAQVHLTAESRFDHDLVILTLPSDKMRDEPMLRLLAVTVRPDALILSLQPLTKDREFLERFFNPKQLVSGVIHWIAWPTGDHSTEWFVPPASAMWLMGPEQMPVALMQAALVKAGVSTLILTKDKFNGRLKLGNAAMMLWIAALEVSNWSFSKLLTDKLVLNLVAASGNLVCTRFFERVFFTREFIWVVKTFGNLVLPFALQPYLQKHFTKVGTQTQLALQEIAQDLVKSQIDPEPINELLKALLKKRDST